MSITVFLSSLLFMILALLCGSIIQWANSKVKAYKPPVSVLWFAFGMIICATEIMVTPNRNQVHDIPGTVDIDPKSLSGLLSLGIAEAARVHSSILYHLVLPILLYDATQQISWHYFRRSAKTGLLLAIGGVIVQVMIIGALMHYTFILPWTQSKSATVRSLAAKVGGIPLSAGSSFSFSMMTASAVASTDPIAVISVLDELKAPPEFSSLFDSEALINDGSSIFLFTFFKAMTKGQQESWIDCVREFAALLTIGPIFGVLTASLLYRWLKHFRWYPYDKTIAVVVSAYFVFFVAEIYLKTSAPLAIVAFGLYFKAYAKAAFDANAAAVHHHFVRGCANMATSAVFILSGVASLRMIWDAHTSSQHLVIPDDIRRVHIEGAAQEVRSKLWEVPVFYLYLNAARFLMLGVFYPLLKNFIVGFTWRHYLLLSWGGLRGAVCLILALLVEQDENIGPEMRQIAALHIASAAVLVLFANGMTFEYLYKLLSPFRVNHFRKVYLSRVMELIDQETHRDLEELKRHWLFENSSALEYAERLVPQLAKISMDEFGKINLSCPKISKILDSLHSNDLARIVSARSAPPHAFNDADKGHSTAAVVQRLRRLPEPKLDIEMNLKLVETKKSIIVLPRDQQLNIRHNKPPDQINIPVNDSAEQTVKFQTDNLPTPTMRRVPGYKYDAIMRLRSEPPGAGTLDSLANLDIREPLNKPSTIPRAMSVPNRLDVVLEDAKSNSRGGEILAMVINSMRKLYKTMYGQYFMSGTVYLSFNSTADLVAEFGFIDISEKYGFKHHTAVVKSCKPQTGEWSRTAAPVTGFELEWWSTRAKLRINSNSTMKNMLNKIASYFNFVSPKTRQSKVFQILRKSLLAVWRSTLSPRQTFAALDDLQCICAFVDVHEELQARGGDGLRLVMGSSLTESFEKQIKIAKSTVEILKTKYCNSYPYAIVCHAAIFLINSKIQLVEEEYERGLLLAEDMEKICERLREELVAVPRYHPYHTFT